MLNIYIYIDAYFSCELMILNILHLFVLPDVAFSSVPCPMISLTASFLSDIRSSLTTTLYII